MDPMAILATGKAAVETATDVVGKVVDMSEKMKDGAARREADSRKLEASILYGKWATVFEGVGVATTAAQTVSSIVKEQRESKAQAATVYAAIEDKHKQVEAEINHARRELELSYQKAEREMKRQSKADDQQYQMELNKHEAKLLELQRQNPVPPSPLNSATPSVTGFPAASVRYWKLPSLMTVRVFSTPFIKYVTSSVS